MNREIKFNIIIVDNSGEITDSFYEWIGSDGEWYNNYQDKEVSTHGVFTSQLLGDGFLGKIIRRQYIEEKDKNGKEIYEGDILSGEWIDGDCHTSGEITVRKKGMEYPQLTECFGASSGVLYHSELKISDFEIIGNIHEQNNQ